MLRARRYRIAETCKLAKNRVVTAFYALSAGCTPRGNISALALVRLQMVERWERLPITTRDPHAILLTFADRPV